MVPERTHASLTDCGSTTICISFPFSSVIRRVVVTITLVVVAVPDLSVEKLSAVSESSHSATLRPCAELLQTDEPLLNPERAFSVARIVFEYLCAFVCVRRCFGTGETGQPERHITVSHDWIERAYSQFRKYQEAVGPERGPRERANVGAIRNSAELGRRTGRAHSQDEVDVVLVEGPEQY